MNHDNELAELLREWSPPVELTRSTPRESRLTTGGVLLVILAFALFGGAIGLGVFLGSRVRSDAARHKALEEQGRDLDAVITRLWHTGGKEDVHRVAYAFEWEGQTYRGQSDVPRRIWTNLTLGDSLPIRVVPSNPKFNHPRQWPYRPLTVWVPIFVALALTVPAILILIMVRRQKQLIEDGRAAPAVILDRKKVHHTHGGGQAMVAYEFPLLNGGVAKGKSSAPKRGGEVGSVLCAIYLPDNPRRNSLYPLDLARPAE